jgi:DNA (cytosine-5)-methyltransferase 1
LFSCSIILNNSTNFFPRIDVIICLKAKSRENFCVNRYISRINSFQRPTLRSNGLVSASIFSGGGGLDLGLSFAGFDIRYANDLEKSYCDTINSNFPDCFVDVKDVREITAQSITESIGDTKVELLSGGSPCQDRGKLVFEFIRIIQELSPKAFVFENVPGILSLNKGEDWLLLKSKFESTGYKIYNQVLNAADFGVPQIRKRLFVIGFREHISFDFPRPTHRDFSQSPDLLEYTLSEWLPAKLALENVTDLKNHDIRPHGDRVKKRYKKVPQGSRDIVDHTHRIHPDKPSGTVLVGSKAGGGRPHIHPYEPRHITPREAARLQSFPDWYTFIGTQTSQYRQIGNAVPPLLAYMVGTAIREALDSSSSSIISRSVKTSLGVKRAYLVNA